MNLEPKTVVSRVETNAMKLGGMLGYLAPMQEQKGVIGEHMEALTTHDFMAAIKEFLAGTPWKWNVTKPFFEAGLQLAIAGYVGKELNLHPALNRIGNAGFKFGAGMALGTIPSTIVMALGAPGLNNSENTTGGRFW